MKYRSCSYIESGLVLGNKRLQFCCVPHSDATKGFVKICDYDGGPLPMETIRSERARLTALNNDPSADSPCKGCWNLVERDWPERAADSRVDWIGIESYFLCNLKCVYCDVVLHEDWKLPAEGFDLRAIFGEMLARGWLEPGTRIVWGGGEPTVLRGFERIQELLAQHDVFQQIHTNAVRWSDTIAAALARGRAELVCSVDAGTRATYARIKGGDHFERVWEHLARYARGGGVPTLKYIVRDGNNGPADVLGFLERAAAIGARRIALSADMEEVNQGALTEEHALAFALLSREAKRRGMTVAIVEEYLPNERARLLGAIDDPALDRRLARAAARRTFAAALRSARRRVRRAHGAWHARAALRRFARVAEHGGRPEDALELLAHAVRWPDPRVSEALVTGARHLPSPLAQWDGDCVALGLDPDGWSLAGRPAFVGVDNLRGAEPLEQVLWVACYAVAPPHPITVRIADGLGAQAGFTYHAPERRRIRLPPVAPGECAVFEVVVDRGWTSPPDERVLGVHLSTRA